MSMKDRVSHITPLPLTMPGATSSIVDRQGYNSLTIICTIGAVGGTLGFQHGDLADGTDRVAVPDQDIVGPPASRALDGLVGAARMAGYVGEKRYVCGAIAGGAGTVANVWAIFGDPALGPTPNPPTTDNLALLTEELEAPAAPEGGEPAPAPAA